MPTLFTSQHPHDLQESLREIFDNMEQLEGEITKRIEHMEKQNETNDNSPPQSLVLSQELTAQVRSCRLKYQPGNLQQIFTKFAINRQGIEKSDFWSALTEIGSEIRNRSEADEVFRNCDKQSKGYLDLEEFKSAVDSLWHSETLLLDDFGLQRLVAFALPKRAGKTPSEVFRGLKQHEVKAMVQAVAGELEQILSEHIEQLNNTTGEPFT
jgi:hypothetical protein